MTILRTRRATLAVLLALGLAGCGGGPAPAPPAPGGAPDARSQLGSGLGGWETQSPAPSAAPSAAGSPGAPASAAPSPAGSPLPGGQGPGLIAFASNRDDGGGRGFDIFVYDPMAATVLALPGVNTDDDEISPSLSANGRYLVYATDENGDFDIRRFDLQSQIIDSLRTLNTTSDEVAPWIDDAGDTIAFVSLESGDRRLRLHDVGDQKTSIVAPVERLGGDVQEVSLSADGRWIAFAADGRNGSDDLYVYDRDGGTLYSPPFVNTEDDERSPVLSANGRYLLYVSEDLGSDDIRLADLQTGFVDQLILANTNDDESKPRFLNDDSILFVSDRSGDLRLYRYRTASGLVDTLPIANIVGDDSTIGDPTANGGGGGGGFGGGFGGIGGTFGGIGGGFF